MDFPPKRMQEGALEHSGEPITQPIPPGFCVVWLKEGAHQERNISGDLSRWTEGGASASGSCCAKIAACRGPARLEMSAPLPRGCPARVTRWFLTLWDEAHCTPGREAGWAPVPPGASGIGKHSGGPASASRAPVGVKSRPPRHGDAAPAWSPLPGPCHLHHIPAELEGTVPSLRGKVPLPSTNGKPGGAARPRRSLLAG